MNHRIIELWDYDFAWMCALERARCERMPDVPAVKIYDALQKSRIADPSTIIAIMRALGCPCDDDEDDERCRVVRIVEVNECGWIVDDHPSEG